MCNYFPAANFKFLLPVIFSLVSIFPVSSQQSQTKDTNKLKAGEALKDPIKDTIKLPGQDTLKSQAKDTLDSKLADSVIYKQMTFSAEEIVRGERLFYGLVYLTEKSD